MKKTVLFLWILCRVVSPAFAENASPTAQPTPSPTPVKESGLYLGVGGVPYVAYGDGANGGKATVMAYH